MPIDQFDPTTYHPKRVGSGKISDNSVVSKSPSAPKGMPADVKKKNPKDGMVSRKIHPPQPASTPSGSANACPDDVQKFNVTAGSGRKSGY